MTRGLDCCSHVFLLLRAPRPHGSSSSRRAHAGRTSAKSVAQQGRKNNLDGGGAKIDSNKNYTPYSLYCYSYYCILTSILNYYKDPQKSIQPHRESSNRVEQSCSFWSFRSQFFVGDMGAPGLASAWVAIEELK